MQTDGIIILVGDHRVEDQVLSHVASERCLACLDVYDKFPNLKILATGGQIPIGSDKAHAYHLIDFLVEHGIPNQDILPPVLGKSILESALLARDPINRLQVDTLYVVASDFNRGRVNYIFNQLFEEYQVKVISATTIAPQARIKEYDDYEEESLGKLISGGIVFPS